MRRLLAARNSALVLAAVLAALTFVALPLRQPGWDAAVYWGAGKFIYTAAQAGLWEPLRPPLFPLILGPFWLVGIPATLAFLIIGVLSVVAIVLLLCALADRLGMSRLALLATVSPLIIFSASRGLTEIPAVVLLLASLLLFCQDSFFLAGLAAGIAVLIKFPMGVILIAFVGAVLLGKEGHRRIAVLRFVGGWLIPMLIFLVANQLAYGDMLRPFIEGNDVIGRAGLSLYEGGWGFYVWEAVKDNFLLLLAPVGLVLALRRRSRSSMAIAMLAVLLFGYFTILEHKEVRFLALFLPVAGLLASTVLQRLSRWDWVVALIITCLVFQAGLNLAYYSHYDAPYDDVLARSDATLAARNATVLVNDPRPTLAIDNRLDLLYYPFFDQESMVRSAAKLSTYQTVILNACGMACFDDGCRAELPRFMDALNSRFTKAGNTTRQDCDWVYYTAS